MLVGDAAVGAVHPGLQVGDRAVRARQQLLAGRGRGLRPPTVLVAVLGEHAIGLQPVGVHDRAGRCGRLREVQQRGSRGIGQDGQPQPSGALAANFDRDAPERLLAALAPALEACFVTTEEELVDLDLVRERRALGRDHRAAQLLQDQPRRLIAREPELALQLLGRDPGVVGGDQVRGPEPRSQRRARAVHHGPGRH